MYKLKTKRGAIRISRQVIGTVVSDAIADFHKTVYLVNKKGIGIGDFGEEYRANAGNLFEISTEDNSVEIRIFIIIKFGESIRLTTDRMMALIRKELKERLRIEPSELAIHILGVKSKDIAKRNVVVKG